MFTLGMSDHLSTLFMFVVMQPVRLVYTSFWHKICIISKIKRHIQGNLGFMNLQCELQSYKTFESGNSYNNIIHLNPSINLT